MSFLKKLFNKKDHIQIEEETTPTTPTAQTDTAIPTQKEDEETPSNHTDDDFVMLRDDGVRAMRMGQLPYAERCFTAALERQDDETTKSYLAEIYIGLNVGEKALPILDELTQKHPDEVKLFLAKAQAAHQCSDWNAMNEAADQIIRIDPENPNGPFNKAQAQSGLKDYIQAVTLLTQLLTNHTDATQARMLRAKVLYEMQQYEEAEKDVDQIINDEQATEETYALKGDIRAALGDAEGAIANYDNMKEINPFNQDAVLKTGKVYQDNHQLDKALKVYDEAIELQPNFAQAYKERGGVRLQLHDDLGATDDLKKALELAPEEAQKVDGEFKNVQDEMEARYRTQNPFGF